MTQPVSRETSVPPPPPAAVALFGPALPAARRYAGWLVGEGVTRGLIGPREVPRVWDRHLVNCAGLAEIADKYVSTVGGNTPVVFDLGSGAGLPGIVLALLRPNWRLVLIEPMKRRVGFLEEVIDDLALAHTVVVPERAETYRPPPKGRADIVVARAVAPLDRLVPLALPLVRPGGCLLALKGETAATELQAARAAIVASGGVDSEVIAVPLSPSRVVRVVAGEQPRTARSKAKKPAGTPTAKPPVKSTAAKPARTPARKPAAKQPTSKSRSAAKPAASRKSR